MDNRKFFALEILILAAEAVKIDFWKCAAALTLFADIDEDSELCCVCRAGDSIDQETADIAHGLMDTFGSISGREILYLLGTATHLMHDGAMMARDDMSLDEDEEKDASCADFARFVGKAEISCAKYADQDKPQKIGGKARADGYRKKKEAVIEIYKQMDGVHSMSADSIAGEIIGKVDLSHRTISDTLREYIKMRDAKHNAHDAE